MSARLLRLSLLVPLVAALALPAPPVEGHAAGKFYGAEWIDRRVEWRFDNDFPRSRGARKAVLKGSRQWNRAGARLGFRREERDREAGELDPCGQPRGTNFVQWGRIDGPGGRLAVTATCTFGTGTGTREMYSFQMKFDSAESWHKDPSTQPEIGETDLWAVASHEFGHAGGRITGGPDGEGHFGENSRFCPALLNERRHTMCPSNDFIGVFMRTLARHDIHTFRNAYGEA